MKQKSVLWVLRALVGVVLLAGCAAFRAQHSPESIVRERAKERWEALLAGDLEKAYEFFQPSYRALRDLKFFQASISRGLAQWTNADVIGVECKPQVCSARIRVDYKLPPGKGPSGTFNAHYDEQWIEEKGNWWLYER